MKPETSPLSSLASQIPHSIPYRPEVDGLRALAVLPVVLFHAGFSLFSGGFVGVDIFFVISGFLISTILLHEKSLGKFTLVGFYERRARRILPALFIVLAVSIIFSAIWMTPDKLVDFGKSIVAVTAYVSNILFWRESGYFDTASAEKPLLHTWTLAVEEQFYIFFPLIIMVVWSLGRRFLLPALIAIGIGSFVMSEWGWRTHPTGNFYLTPTRAWEFVIGSIAALHLLHKPHGNGVSQGVAQVLALIGMAFILLSVFTYDETTPFPSFYTLLPTVGAALIIVFADGRTWVGKTLSIKPLVGIGLISYSAYLWHQPIFAFARLYMLTDPSLLVFAGLTVLSFVCAYLSWRYVEIPFRDKKRFDRKQIFLMALVSSIVMIAIGAGLIVTKGLPQRFAPQVEDIATTERFRNPRQEECLAGPGHYIPADKACRIGSTDTVATVALIGDSHADAIFTTLDAALVSSGQGGVFFGYRGCPPIIGVFRPDQNIRHECAKHNEETYRHLTEDKNIKTIVVMSRWTAFLSGVQFNNQEGGKEFSEHPAVAPIGDDRAWQADDALRQQQVAKLYTQSLTKLVATGKKVILVYPVPETGWNVPQYLAKNLMQGDALGAQTGSTSAKLFKDRNAMTYDALNDVGKHKNLIRVYPENMFCDTVVSARCIVHRGEVPLYYDSNHLSPAGAQPIVDAIMTGIRR